jgi:ADP-heptose:LPS heptosyltransferase
MVAVDENQTIRSTKAAPRLNLNPGGFVATRWRSEHYFDLAKHLVANGRIVLLTGSPAEAEQAKTTQNGGTI